MNALITLRRSTSLILSTLALSSLATVALAQTSARLNVLGTPNDGVICRSGYTASFGASSMKCSKTTEILVVLACLEPRFTDKIVRASAGGTPDGLDVCDKPGGVTITSTNDISNFNKGGDYVFAKKDDAQIALRVANQRQAEATALGLTLSEVEVEDGIAVTDTSLNTSEDKSRVPLTFFTFPVRTAGAVIGPINPAPTAFVPRALPR
jgi:nucleotide-binding universal stress UspA family protein